MYSNYFFFLYTRFEYLSTVMADINLVLRKQWIQIIYYRRIFNQIPSVHYFLVLKNIPTKRKQRKQHVRVSCNAVATSVVQRRIFAVHPRQINFLENKVVITQ